MFHHVTLFRLRAGVPLHLVRSARTSLAALIETLPGVHFFDVAHNVSEHNAGFTLALFAGFDDRRAYEIFTRHADYQQVLQELLQPLVEEQIVAEAEVGDETG